MSSPLCEHEGCDNLYGHIVAGHYWCDEHLPVSSPLDTVQAAIDNERRFPTVVVNTEIAQALVNVAKAAERQAQREPGSLDTAIREALAALNKEPA